MCKFKRIIALITMNVFTYSYKCELSVDQIRAILYEMNNFHFMVKWSERKKRFIIRRRRETKYLERVPINVKVKGEITQAEDGAFVRLALAPVVSLMEGIVFSSTMLLVLLLSGLKAGVDLKTILIMFVVFVTISYLFVYLLTRFTQEGMDLYIDTIERLERSLGLKIVQ